MGCHENISAEKYPKQSYHLLERVKICFNCDTTKYFYGTVIRDDIESPFETIFLLDNQTVIKSVECQYQLTNWFLASLSEIEFDERVEQL